MYYQYLGMEAAGGPGWELVVDVTMGKVSLATYSVDVMGWGRRCLCMVDTLVYGFGIGDHAAARRQDEIPWKLK